MLFCFNSFSTNAQAVFTDINCVAESKNCLESENKYVYLGGNSFGVKFYSDGVIVTELENFYDGKKFVCPSKTAGIRINDIVKKVNGQEITSNENFQNVISKCKGQSLKLLIDRKGKTIEKTVTPIKNAAGMYLIGIWIRDSCAGIGTVTYYDKESNSFAGLGHGICDVDTKALMPLNHAEIVKANISGITKSEVAKPGSLCGYFTDCEIGSLTKNSNLGIYGKLNESFTINDKRLQIAKENEIKTGNAIIYTTINGDKTGCYKIKITRICNNNRKSNENFVIKVTDDRLLSVCGGIVQGMSGSPIVQNGKLVGAITHMFVNKPDEGYGVIAQYMVDNSN